MEPGARCVPGEAWRCQCDDGRSGQQRCKSNGDGFGACKCGAAAMMSSSMSSPTSATPMTQGMAPKPMSQPQPMSKPQPMSTGMPAAGASAPQPPAMPRMYTVHGPRGDVDPEPLDEAQLLFDDTLLHTYDILVEPHDLAAIDAQPSAERYVPARLVFDGKTYGPFKLRYKGGSGTFKKPCTAGDRDTRKAGKCSMKLGFDEVDPELRFFGLKKLNFHAMGQDPSLLRDRLAYSLFRDHQVAASRAVHARVLVNGVLEGLFVVVEQVDGRFTRARFSEGGKGNVYKDAWVTVDTEETLLRTLETNSREMPSVQRMLDLQKAVQTSATETARFFDLDYMMRYLAVDRVIVNDDGVMHFYCDAASPNYPGTNQNFYWYEASGCDRLWLIPWDLDLSFDATPYVHVKPQWTAPADCTCLDDAPPYDPQMAPACDPLVKHWIGWRNEFEREVDRFLAGPFAQARVDAKLDAWTAQLEPLVKETAGLKGAPTESEWQGAVNALRTTINDARQNRGYRY